MRWVVPRSRAFDCMAAFEAGQIVIADWRDAIPREPNKLRPAVAIEDTALFDSLYPDVILFPL